MPTPQKIDRQYVLDLITKHMDTAEGRTKLYSHMRTTMRNKLYFIQKWEPGFEEHMYDVIPEREFWVTVGRQSEAFGKGHVETFSRLSWEMPNPAAEPPHPWLRRVEKQGV